METIDLKAFMDKNMPRSYNVPAVQKYQLASPDEYYISNALKKYGLTYR